MTGTLEVIPMVSITPRAIPKLQQLQREARAGVVFRVLYKGFG